MEKTFNPDVAVRMRGVVEKCNFCYQRYHRASERAAARGEQAIDPSEYVPACAESCPTEAIVFGDLGDRSSEVAQGSGAEDAFRLLEQLGTGPKISYRSRESWVREAAERPAGSRAGEEKIARG
jgi:molybdopterin-containing oxidoreductase family iron-sulfur binding subunit